MNAKEISKALSCGRSGCSCGREYKSGTWRTHCPAHADETPSLDVTQAGEKVLLKCFAGCSQEAVIKALQDLGLWPSGNRQPKLRQIGNQAQAQAGLTLAEFAQKKKLDLSFLRTCGVSEAVGRDGKPYLTFTYRDLDGKPIPEATRLRFSMSDKPKAKRGGKPALYGLCRLPEFRKGGELLLVEGESDCLTAWSYGLPALGLPGKGLTKTLDPAHFSGFRTVYVWQEPDATELPGEVAARLRSVDGLTVKVLLPPEGVKDISEAHCRGDDIPALVARLQAVAEVAVITDPQAQRQKTPKQEIDITTISFEGLTPAEARKLRKAADLTTSQTLCLLAQKAELFHDKNRDGYASINGLTYPVDSNEFRLWLRGEYDRIFEESPNGQALRDAIGNIEARAVFRSPEYPVFVRVAELYGKIYVDLADDRGRAVEVSKNGWQVIDRPPVKFLRRRGMLPLPEPKKGDISILKRFLNLPDDGGRSFTLIVAWLVMAFRPSGPYPVLSLIGPQGSAKSTVARVLRLLVDPNSSPLRAEPKEVRDLMISARNGWIVCLDNLTSLQPWLSDCLCRLSTGGGFTTRALYRDSDEVFFEAMRPIILTGINTVATAHDLADRQILIDLPLIGDFERLTEAAFWTDFEAARPQIFGALLDGVSMALQRIHIIKLSRRPRMADFADWAAAAEAAWGWPDGTFMAAYDGARAEMVQTSISLDPVAAAVRDFMAKHDRWQGSPTELLQALSEYVSESTVKSRSWPQAANALSKRIRKAAAFLAQISIRCDFDRINKCNLIILVKEKTSTASTTSTIKEYQAVNGGSSGGSTLSREMLTSTEPPQNLHRTSTPNLLNLQRSGSCGGCGSKIPYPYSDKGDGDTGSMVSMVSKVSESTEYKIHQPQFDHLIDSGVSSVPSVSSVSESTDDANCDDDKLSPGKHYKNHENSKNYFSDFESFMQEELKQMCTESTDDS